MNKKVRKIVKLSLVTLIALQGNVKAVVVRNQLIDRTTNGPLISTYISALDAKEITKTHIDGNFEIGLPKKKQILKVNHINYKPKMDTVIVNNNLKYGITTKTYTLKSVAVVARRNTENAAAAIATQKKAIASTQQVAVKEMTRKGATDAEKALAKVSGISKQEGVKNVFIRGLGDRYNATTLNDFPIPSEDPEYKNISLDFFSSDLIMSLDINKVFTSSITGDVGGAHVNVNSKELTSSQKLSISLSGGINTKTIGNDFLKPDGVDGLGFTTAEIPTTNSTNNKVLKFKNSLNPNVTNSLVNRELKIAGGKRFYLGKNENPLSFYVLGSYGTNYSHYDEISKGTTTDGTIERDQIGKKSEQSINEMALANITFRYNNKQTFSYNLMLLHNSQLYVGDYVGTSSEDFRNSDYMNGGLVRRQQLNENSLIVNQLNYKLRLDNLNKFDLGVAYNNLTGKEPDRRIDYYAFDPTYSQAIAIKGDGHHSRSFSELKNKDFNVKAAWNYKLNEDYSNASDLKVGYKGRFYEDNFNANEYDMVLLNAVSYPINHIDLNSYMTEQNMISSIVNPKIYPSLYKVNKTVHTGYAEFTYQINDALIANIGLHYDHINMDIDYDVQNGMYKDKTKFNRSYLLPSFNLKHNFNKKNALRFGASKTYTLPRSKELSPYQYIGVNFKSQGNPNLKPSENYNFDLKYDWYLSTNQLLTVNAFYKYIKNPIARYETNSGGGYMTYENISDHATIAGLEVELRKNVFSFYKGNDLHKMILGLNGSYIYSNTQVVRNPNVDQKYSNVKLEGAAPIIVNADVSYKVENDNFNITNTLVFNFFSTRIYSIGTNGYEDIEEEGTPTLDFISQVNINKHWGLSIKARNILNASNKLTRKSHSGENITLKEYKKGLDLSLGVSYNF